MKRMLVTLLALVSIVNGRLGGTSWIMLASMIGTSQGYAEQVE